MCSCCAEGCNPVDLSLAPNLLQIREQRMVESVFSSQEQCASQFVARSWVTLIQCTKHSEGCRHLSRMHTHGNTWKRLSHCIWPNNYQRANTPILLPWHSTHPSWRHWMRQTRRICSHIPISEIAGCNKWLSPKRFQIKAKSGKARKGSKTKVKQKLREGRSHQIGCWWKKEEEGEAESDEMGG